MKLFINGHGGASIATLELSDAGPVPRVGEEISLPKYPDGNLNTYIVTEVVWVLAGKQLVANVSCVSGEPRNQRPVVLLDHGWLPG